MQVVLAADQPDGREIILEVKSLLSLETVEPRTKRVRASGPPQMNEESPAQVIVQALEVLVREAQLFKTDEQ